MSDLESEFFSESFTGFRRRIKYLEQKTEKLQAENKILREALDSIVDKAYDLPIEQRLFCSIKHKESYHSLLARAALEKIKQGSE